MERQSTHVNDSFRILTSKYKLQFQLVPGLMACSLKVQFVVIALILAQKTFAAEADKENGSGEAKLLSAKAKLLMAFQRLHRLVNSPKQPQGTPFPPLISKPKPSEKIAIVGAGLAGLHMAYELMKKGFNNVVVLEKDSRVGGKVISIKHKGFVHEMGACYTSPDYVTNVYALAKELGVHEFVPLPQSTIWLDKLPFPLPFKKYVAMEIMRLTNAKTPFQAFANLVNATHRYAILHRSMFGKYEGELMWKPSKTVLASLNQTMLSFLTEHGLLAMVPVLSVAHEIPGFGHLDRISALYGVMWNTPTFLTGMLARALDQGEVLHMFRHGFMQLTDKLAALVDVRLNVDIKNIRRDEYSGITIKYNIQTHQDITEDFDYLIWAADAREALKVLERPTPMETTFARLTNTW